MHTILGANGAVARALSLVLAGNGAPVRQVSRRPHKVNPSDEVFAADLLDGQMLAKAIAGSQTVFLVAGLTYDTATWQAEWPQVMRNVIEACIKHQARLVFLDNVYAYGRVKGAMEETCPLNPCSKKGEVRAQIVLMLQEAMARGELQALIARSADFYGPQVATSFLQTTVFERLKAGKAPQWIGNPKALHSFTYVPDIARALVRLSQSTEAYGQVWHLPTSKEPMSGAELVRMACQLAGQKERLQVAPRWMLRFMGRFSPFMRENEEMMYQFEDDYRFDSSKIERAFAISSTPYQEGIEKSLLAIT